MLIIIRYVSEMASLTALRESSQALSLQVNAGEERTARVETELRIEREWRGALQDVETRNKDEIQRLHVSIKLLNDEARVMVNLNHLTISYTKTHSNYIPLETRASQK